MLECSLQSDSYTKAENVYATYLVERQAKEKQAALNKTQNKTTDVFLVERKAEAKQNSAEKYRATSILRLINIGFQKSANG